MDNEKIDESISNVNDAINSLDIAYNIIAASYGSDDIFLNQIARAKYICEDVAKSLIKSKVQAPIEGQQLHNMYPGILVGSSPIMCIVG